MIPFDFDYERPASLEEAVAILRENGPEARLLAGGTDLLPNMRVGYAKPPLLVSLGGIAPAPPRVEPDGTLRIDALSRLTDVIESDVVRDAAPMVAESALAVGGNQVREAGTIGGNLCQENRCLYLNQKHDYQFQVACFKRGGDRCYPFPGNEEDTCWSIAMSDIAPALIALAAGIDIVGENGPRRIAIEELYTGVGLKPLTLTPAEVIRAVLVPPAPPRFGWGFFKSTRRGGFEYGIAVIAIALEFAEDGRTCSGARIALGSVREGPVRLLEAEKALVGVALDGADTMTVAEAAARELSPLPHHGFTKGYIRDTVRIHLRRTLETAIERGFNA